MIDNHSNTTIIAQNLYVCSCHRLINAFQPRRGNTIIANRYAPCLSNPEGVTLYNAQTPIIAQNRNNSNAITPLCYADVDTYVAIAVCCAAMPHKYCSNDKRIAATSANIVA